MVKFKFTKSDVGGVDLIANGPGISIRAHISPDYQFPPLDLLLAGMKPHLEALGYQLVRIPTQAEKDYDAACRAYDEATKAAEDAAKGE